MAKFNHQSDQHRSWLAQNILAMLTKWGFDIDKERSQTSWEFIVNRPDKFDPTKNIVIFTSIDRTSGACRKVGKDAIRVIVEKTFPDGDTRYAPVRKVNRVGEFSAITSRIVESILQAQKTHI